MKSISFALFFSTLIACGDEDKEGTINEDDTGSSENTGEESEDTGEESTDDTDTDDDTDTETGPDGNPINIPVIVEVVAGGYHTCVRFDDNTLDCWGENTYAQSNPPTGEYTQLTAGEYHTCAITVDGDVACWGDNSNGQTITQIGDFTNIDAGRNYTCGVESTGTTTCWDGESSWHESPSVNLQMVTAGQEHNCGLQTDDSIVCWGADYTLEYPVNFNGVTYTSLVTSTTDGIYSQYGDCYGNNNFLHHWYNIIETSGGGCEIVEDITGAATAPVGAHIDVALSKWNGCAIDSAGILNCWGTDTPHSLNYPPGGNWTTSDLIQVEAGLDHFCALDATGVAHCWGSDDSEEIEAPFGTHNFTSIAVGYDHNCGLRGNGELVCWGDNSSYQLGNHGWSAE